MSWLVRRKAKFEKRRKFVKKRKAEAYSMEFVLHNWQLLEGAKEKAEDRAVRTE